MSLSTYKGTKVPGNVIKGWQLKRECEIDMYRKLDREVVNNLTLNIGMQMVTWTIRLELCNRGFIGRVSFRNLEGLKRLEVTSRILNELK